MSLATVVKALDYAERPDVPAHEKAMVVFVSAWSATDDRDVMWVDEGLIDRVVNAFSWEYPNLDGDDVVNALKKMHLRGGSQFAIEVPPDEDAPDVPQDSRAGTVYLVQAGPRYKIGITTDVERRLTQLGQQAPFPVRLVHRINATDARGAESVLHDVYAGARVHGEWFAFSDDEISGVVHAMDALA